MQVDITLSRSAADLLAEFGAGAKLYLESASSSGGSYSAVGSGTPLASGTDYYEVIDSAGVPGTTWYRFRAGNSGGTAYTAYSDPWLSTSLTAYATLDDLVRTLALGGDTSRYAMLSDLLVDVSADLDAACGRQFYRSPQVTGTETFHVTVTEGRLPSLALASRGCTDGKALDLVSLASLSVRDDEGSAYVALTEGTDYYLDPGMTPYASGTGWPYGDVVLIPTGLYATWPTGYAAVEAVGVRGFPKVPGTVRRAVVSEARNRFRGMVPGNQDQQPSGPDDADWARATATPFARRAWVG